MRRFFTTSLLLAVAMVLAGACFAQDAPAAAPAKPSSTPAASKAAKPATAAKTAAKKPAGASAGAAALTTRKQKFSYALGMNIGSNLGSTLKNQSVEVDWNLIAQGMKDAAGAGKTKLTQAEATAVLTEVQNEVRKEQMEKAKQAGAANKAEGEAFLAANKSKEGVVTLPSGLQYKILTAGTGPKPAASDQVVCNYRGTLTNGTEFDSSYKRGQPATFGVGQVIKGWTEALQLMPTGSKWQLFIPSNLAYGEQGAGGGAIGPNSTLVFEVELISIVDKSKEEKKEEKKDEAGEQKK